MKIAVCMKQVPATSQGDMDKKTGVMIRSGLQAIVNVYDLAALEAALRIREQCGGEVHVFTMGPDKAEMVLREAFAMGADEGYLICDKAFAGADVLATSYTLKQAIQSADDYDMILCGRQTTDGDTAQVSGAIAEWMQIPRLNWVTGIDVLDEHTLGVEYCMEHRTVMAKVTLPCLMSVERDGFPPRMPSLKLKICGRKKEIHRISMADLEDQNPEHYGLKGSATRVKKIYPSEQTSKQELLCMEKDEAALYIAEVLNELLKEDGQ